MKCKKNILIWLLLVISYSNLAKSKYIEQVGNSVIRNPKHFTNEIKANINISPIVKSKNISKSPYQNKLK